MGVKAVSKNENIFYVCFVSLIAALGGLLFGYDTAVISGTIGMVSEQFGLNTVMQGWYVSSALIGSIIGVSAAGWISDSIGRKWAMLVSAFFFFISGVGCAMSNTMTILIVYRIVGGIGIGMISIISPMYISEIALARIRGSLVTLYQLAITLGFLAAYLANFKLLEFSKVENGSNNALFQKLFIDEVWRSMLGMEALPALLFLLIIFMLPKSPRWLFVKGRQDEARKVLSNIYISETIVREEMNNMKASILNEKDSNWKLLKKSNLLKAVLIGSVIAILGQFMGVNAVLYYGPTIFEQSGVSSGDALFYQILVGGVNVVTTLIALFIIDRVGRKKLVYFGVSGMIVCLLLIAGYFYNGNEYGLPTTFLLILFLAYIFFTAISISAVIFVLLSEMYPTQIRALAMSIAGLSLWVGTFLVGQLTPWMLDVLSPQGTFLLFAFMCLPYMYIIWKLVPETTGKTLEEIEAFWN